MRVRAVLLIVCAAAVVSGPRIGGQLAISTPALQALPTMSAARTAAFVSAASRKLNYLPGEVVVRFKDGVSTAQVQRALSVVRSQPTVDSLEWAGPVAIVRDATEPDTIQLAQRLAAQPEVQYAEPNYIRHYKATPNDPDYGTYQWNFPAIDLPRAWDIQPGANSSIIIAIVDTGVTNVNQSFTTKTWNGTAIQSINVAFSVSPDLSSSRFVSPMDFIDGFGTTVLDSDGHGTHVGSTAGEDTNNNLFLAGIAYNAKIMPVKACASYWDVQFSMSEAGIPGFADPNEAGGCPITAIAQGIMYAADNGAKVINLSLGGEGASMTELQAIQYAVGKGAFVSMAGGNEYQQGNPVEYPAAYGPNISGAMAVGATNRSGNRAYYSNTGSYLEIAAPGGDDIDSDASGSGFIWQVTLDPGVSDPDFGVVIPTFNQYRKVGYEGTSMATPHVSGVAALLIAQGITSPAAVEDAIRKSAKFLGTPSASNPSRSDEFGFGLIQARAAILGMGIRK